MLEDGGRVAPYVVRVRHKISADVIKTGILNPERDPGKAKAAYEARVAGALEKEWRLGTPARANMLADVPAPGHAKPVAVAAGRRARA